MQSDESHLSNDQTGMFGGLFSAITEYGLSLSLEFVLAIIFGLIAIKGIVSYLNSVLNVRYVQYFIRTLRLESIDLLSNIGYRHFLTYDSGAIQNALSGEVGRVVAAFVEYLRIGQNIIMLVTYVVFAYMLNPGFSAMILVSGLILNFSYRGLFNKTQSLSQKLVKGNDAYQKLLLQKVSSFKYLKATNRLKTYNGYIKSEVLRIEAMNSRMGLINSLINSIREPLLYLVVLSAVLIHVHFFAGTISSILISLLMFYRGLNIMFSHQSNYNAYLALSGSLKNLRSFHQDMHSKSEREGTTNFTHLNSVVTLNNVSYFYRKGRTVLNDVSLSIERNQTVAIVGESGSGKSTLVNILSGLLQPTHGTYLIDGVDVQEINKGSFQSKIGYITQDTVIFDDSVYNNVTFWAEKNERNSLRFEEAMQKAAIWEYFDSLPSREDTRLGTNGIRLSGGQIQRICIARELYRDVEVLLMDEATSALDSNTERSVKDNIDQLKGKLTIIIVAHRLSTIKNADLIVLLNKGSIEAMGSFSTLQKESSLFRSMTELQDLT